MLRLVALILLWLVVAARGRTFPMATEVTHYLCDLCLTTYPTMAQALACEKRCRVPVKWEGGQIGSVRFRSEEVLNPALGIG